MSFVLKVQIKQLPIEVLNPVPWISSARSRMAKQNRAKNHDHGAD